MAHPSFFAAPRASHRPQAGIPLEQIQEIASASIARNDTTFSGPPWLPVPKFSPRRKKLKSSVRATLAMWKR